jgi:DNA-binding MarR family transcriptional regulator
MQNLKDALENVGYDCMAFATRRTARAVTNYFNMLLRRFELNVAQFGLMTAIAKMPNRTLREIGEHLILDESTVTRNLTILERRNLVQAEGGRGRAGKRMTLTPEGEELMLSAVEEWRRGNKALTDRVPDGVMDGGLAFLKAVTEASGALKAGELLGAGLEPADID